MTTEEQRAYGRIYSKGYAAGMRAAENKKKKLERILYDMSQPKPKPSILDKVISLFRAGI